MQTVQLAHLRSVPTINQIEKAVPPAEPVRPQPRMYTILGGLVGLILATGLVFIIEYLDDTLKTRQDVQQALDIPVLGNITNMQHLLDSANGAHVPWQYPFHGSEAMDALLANLEFSATGSPLKTLLLLSVNETGEGKTNIAADLAVSYAQLGTNVILLDADLRNPSVHRYFGLPCENGFSNLLADRSKAETIGQKIETLDSLTVITGGNAPQTPATDGVTMPNRIVNILEVLKEQTDVIIIDAPPINVADSWVMASKVDGVLLIIQSGNTHLSEVRHLLEQLNRARAKILGAVLYQYLPQNLAYYSRNIRKSVKAVLKETPNLRFGFKKEEPDLKSDEKLDEKPDEELDEKLDKEPDVKLDEKPDEEPDQKLDEKLNEEPDEKLDEKPDEKPDQKLDEEPDQKLDEKPDEKLDEKPDEEPDQKLDEEPDEKLDEKPDEKPDEELTEKPDEKADKRKRWFLPKRGNPGSADRRDLSSTSAVRRNVRRVIFMA